MYSIVRLPEPRQGAINELFGYGIEEFEENQGLKPGSWVFITFGLDSGDAFESGGPAKLRRLFIEGMDALTRLVAHTDVQGVFGDTDRREILLRHVGFDIIDGLNEANGYRFSRYCFMPLARFLERPWQVLC
ncbi:MAG: hypothetical protein V4480_04290 [Patescibacteria group bacterium]